MRIAPVFKPLFIKNTLKMIQVDSITWKLGLNMKNHTEKKFKLGTICCPHLCTLLVNMHRGSVCVCVCARIFGINAQSNAPTHSHIPPRETDTRADRLLQLYFHSYCPQHNLIGWDKLTAGQMFQRRHTWEVRTCAQCFQHVCILTPWTGELSQPVSQTDPMESPRSRLSEGQDEETEL